MGHVSDLGRRHSKPMHAAPPHPPHRLCASSHLPWHSPCSPDPPPPNRLQAMCLLSTAGALTLLPPLLPLTGHVPALGRWSAHPAPCMAAQRHRRQQQLRRCSGCGGLHGSLLPRQGIRGDEGEGRGELWLCATSWAYASSSRQVTGMGGMKRWAEAPPSRSRPRYNLMARSKFLSG